jgi:hypothetical protein
MEERGRGGWAMKHAWERQEIKEKYSRRNLSRRCYFGVIGLEGRIILKWALKK